MIEQFPSPNHSDRRGHKVQVLVLHATGGSWGSALGWMRNPASEVSAHYLVGKDGRVAQLVGEDRAAWHAGVSQWRGLEVWSAGPPRIPSLNLVSVGIELVNANDGRDAYPAPQVDAAVHLSRAIISRHGIRRENIVRHLDIAPGRKSDPAGLNWLMFVDAIYSAPILYQPPPPAPPPPKPYRVKAFSYVRKEASNASGVAVVDRLDGGSEVKVVRVVKGALFTHKGVTSDQWAELASGGFVWLPQLEAV